MQYGGGYSVWRKHIISKMKVILSTDVSHNQYGGGTPSVWWSVCSMDLSHHSVQRRVCSAVQDYQNFSRGSW